jgi:8-oxo-dGTP pyrophosphatase MutT (NUDIX family)
VIKAAGILFITAADEVLLLKRGASGDHEGEWCFPGGTTEDGETAEQTAVRECEEEIGRCPEGERAVLTRRIADGVDFTTFLQRVPETFTPKLNDEHTGWAWVSKDAPSEPLHPGARVAIERLSMNELDIARAMARGDLVSPQTYENISLVDIRITGTGMAFRKALKEYVWREPDLYMTEEFLQRCNGLPVIWMHPIASTLNSKEFSDRIVGTVFLPYFNVEAKEVWAIVKIYDDDAKKLIDTEVLSTSPAVVFRDPKVNTKHKLSDGSVLLQEGLPSLLDHIAITGVGGKGVWDKAGPATGVQNDLLETQSLERADSMTTEEEKAAADKAKADAEAKVKADADNGEKLNKMLSCLDSMSARMDAMEEDSKARKAADKARKDEEEMADRKADAARFDAAKEEFGKKYPDAAKRFDAEEEDEKKKHEGETEEVAADRARKDRSVKMDKHRKDAEEEEAKKKADEARGDAARADSAVTIAELQREMASLKAQMKPHTDDEVDALAAAQARADAVYMALGKRASRPMSGETLHAYNIRLTREVQKHSPKWGKTELNRLPADTLATIQADVYADAVVAARNPDDVEPGTLREIKTPDSSGRIISTFVGKGTFIGAMKMPSRRVTAIHTDARR